jgi:hypothetical protein
MHGAPKRRHINRSKTNPTTVAGKINQHQTTGVPMPMMLRRPAQPCLLLPRLL